MHSETHLTVDAYDGYQDIRSITSEGVAVSMGQIRYRDYEENRSLRVPYFIDQAGKDHRLGSATGQFQILDHLTVLQPLLDLGFTPRLLNHSRGGVDLFAVMERRDVTFPDPISWDQDQYLDGEDGDEGLSFAIGVRSSLRVGKGFILTGGFFRVICTNGLIASVLGLGRRKLNHRNFEVASVHEFAKITLTRVRKHEFPTFSSKGFGWARELITSYFSADEEHRALGMARLPEFIQPSLRSLEARLPIWAQESLQQQLESAATRKERLDSLDILNVLTNLANHAPRGEGTSFRIYRYLEPMSSSLTKLVQLGDLIADPASLMMTA